MAIPPIFKLSLEMRNEIYGYIFIRSRPIHVRKDSDTDDWIFTICRAVSAAERMNCRCLENKAKHLDVALICVSKQVQQEAMAVLMSRNFIALMEYTPSGMEKFTRAFGARCAAVQSMDLR